MNLIITCEHAGNEIPERYSKYFEGADEILESHRGYDPGALDLFNRLGALAIFSQPYMISRLLVEPNRSLDHPQLFSEFITPLEESDKEEILTNFYLPYRNYIEGRINSYLSEGKRILHLSVHTFTPVLNGEERDADIGLLFDPSRDLETEFCKSFRLRLLEQDRNLRVRFNYPYLGVDDGFTTTLRTKFTQEYLGIELEVNQKYVQDSKMQKRLKNVIFEALSKAVNTLV